MSDVLHVVRDGKWIGPFSVAQLRALATAGRLRPTDAVWKEGMAKAVLVTKVKNLFPSQSRPSSPETTEVPCAPVLPTPVVSPSVALATDPPTSPEQVRGTADEHAPAAAAVLPVTPALPSTAGQATGSKAGPNTATAVRPRTRRAVGMKGAILISQDGYNVHYRKKCSQCGFEDTCRSTMLINIGTTRSHFFCPKCRKSREVQIQGCMQ